MRIYESGQGEARSVWVLRCRSYRHDISAFDTDFGRAGGYELRAEKRVGSENSLIHCHSFVVSYESSVKVDMG